MVGSENSYQKLSLANEMSALSLPLIDAHVAICHAASMNGKSKYILGIIYVRNY